VIVNPFASSTPAAPAALDWCTTDVTIIGRRLG
jgi:hypothetical protein